jgi:hypothetical protein
MDVALQGGESLGEEHLGVAAGLFADIQDGGGDFNEDSRGRPGPVL